MKNLTEIEVAALNEPLPSWAVKPHPTKKGMSAIHPMAIIDRLNDVFGIGGWNTNVEKLSSREWMQETKSGSRKVYTATSKVTFSVPECNIGLAQFGGSTNDDEGDALKGSATDALTKIASYLGIGASIYKGHGNVAPGSSQDSLEASEDFEYGDTVAFSRAMENDRV